MRLLSLNNHMLVQRTNVQQRKGPFETNILYIKNSKKSVHFHSRKKLVYIRKRAFLSLNNPMVAQQANVSQGKGVVETKKLYKNFIEIIFFKKINVANIYMYYKESVYPTTICFI